jgi:hypothetical protein
LLKLAADIQGKRRRQRAEAHRGLSCSEV